MGFGLPVQRTINIRAMSVDDADISARLFVDGFRRAFVGLISDSFLDLLDVGALALRRRLVLAEAGVRGEVGLLAEDASAAAIGYASLGPYFGDDGMHQASPGTSSGEFYSLYAHVDHVGTGVGRALVAEVVERARQRGYKSFHAWPFEKNERIQRVLSRAGFQHDRHMRRICPIDGIDLVETRYSLTVGA